MKHFTRVLYSAVIALGATAMPLQAQTYISWTSPLWDYVDDAGNWDLNYVPGTGAADTVIIDNGGLALVDDTHHFGPNPLSAIPTDYGMYIGDAGSGALQQSGGTVATNQGLILGHRAGSYGYYELSGTSSELNITSSPGGYPGVIPLMIGMNGTGVYNQTGGTAKIGQQLWAVGFSGGSSVTCQMSVRGGTLTSTTPGSQPVVIVGWNSNGMFNIGGAADVNLEKGVVFMGHDGGSGTLNLGDVKSGMGGAGGVNGGGGILRTAAVFGYDGDGRATVNFHGGTLQVTSSNPPPPYVPGGETFGFFNLLGGKAYVYSEGALIDTNGFNAEVNTGLDTPNTGYGQGITGIALDPGSLGSGYIGEPVVSIMGGGGTGATARAILDGSGGIDHVEIANPGVGYVDSEWDPILVNFSGGGNSVTLPLVNTISLADNVSGGLTKTGPGNLSLNAYCTYTGATTVQEGRLIVGGMGNITSSSGVAVKKNAVLGGSGYVPGVLVEGDATGGGTVDPGDTVGGTGMLFANGLHLQNNSNLHFDLLSGGTYADQISVAGDVDESSPGSAVTVHVSYNAPSGFTTTQTLINVSGGLLDPNGKITFALPSKQTLDSNDGQNASQAELRENAYTLELLAAGPIPDPSWNNAAGGNYSTLGNWGDAPYGPVPLSGTQRAMFTRSLSPVSPHTNIPITLDADPALSSMIFNNYNGEYRIIPSGGHFITMNSSLATDWHITVLGGSHTVDADMLLAAGTDQSVIRLNGGAKLTLNGDLGDLDPDHPARVAFNGDFSNYGTPGTLVLAGANSYTGKTTVENGILELKSLGNVAADNTLGRSPADPANFTLKNSTLQYSGPAGQSTDRGFTVKGTSTVLLNANAGFAGQLAADASSTLTVTGPGTLTLGYAGAETSAVETIQVVDGALTIGANAKLQVNVAGFIGCNGSAGDLTINDGGEFTSPSTNRFEIANSGSSHVVLSGTSTTSPATLSIGGTAWIGFNTSGIASTALVELSGTAEMHIATAGLAQVGYPNVHIGLGAETTGTISMTDDSKFTCEVVTRPDGLAGGLGMGDLGGTANVNLSDNASFSVPNTHVALGSSTGGIGRITLNDSAAFTSGGYVYLGVADAAEAAVTLNGGTFTAPYFVTTGPGVINFNGGVLKASADSNNYIQGATFTVNVQAGGAKIDTNGFNVTVARALRHDPALGTIDGGLTKLGVGTLALTEPNTYTGPTVVKDGTLLVKKIVTDPNIQAITTAPNATGNRGGPDDPAPGPYSLGRIFEVKPDKSIQVTQLGVFDDSGDGLAQIHTVHLTEVTTPGSETDLTSVDFLTGTSATYQNGFRFISLDTPLTLNPGRYQIWVDSIGGPEIYADKFGENISTFNVGSGAITLDGPFEEGLTSYYGLTPGSRPDQPWGYNDADASFVYYDPGSVIPAGILVSTTPVLLGGAAGSTPTLDVQGANQEIASLADVAGAVVKGVVTNSDSTTPVVLTLGAATGATAYSGSIEGNLSLVKSAGSTQTLSGPLTYTGDTTVLGGTLNASALNTPSGDVGVYNNAVLNAGSITAATLTIGGAMRASAPQAVPEPSTLLLLVLAGLGVLLARRRK